MKTSLKRARILARGGLALLIVGLLAPAVASQSGYRARARTGAAPLNSWRGITPLRSSAADVAEVLGISAEEAQGSQIGPLRVDGGEVTITYLTDSLAKIYRAPRAMVGKVFTITFTPGAPQTREGLYLKAGFRRCVEDLDKSFYYLVNDAGLVYRFHRGGENLDAIIYQPSRAEVRRLAVNTVCVF